MRRTEILLIEVMGEGIKSVEGQRKEGDLDQELEVSLADHGEK